MKKAPNPEVDFTRFRRQISASSSKLLECQRAQLVKVTVPADSIVKALNAIKHVGFGFLAGSIDAPFVSFFLQAAEEGLGNCIVPTVSEAAHAGQQLVVFAPAVEIITAKLAALV